MGVAVRELVAVRLDVALGVAVRELVVVGELVYDDVFDLDPE